MSDLLTVDQLSRTYFHGTETLHVLKDLDLHLASSEFVAIVGASGAGKSTLLHLLGSLDKATSGEISLDGCRYSTLDPAKMSEMRNEKIGFVFQFHHLLPEFTALENVMMPGLIRGKPRKALTQKAESLLEKLSLKDRITHKPSELSGGEQQRVAVARALVNDPLLLMMDEPTGNLDRINGERLFDLIKNIQKTSRVSAIMVTHNQALAKQTDRTLLLQDGKLLPYKES